MWGLWGEGGEGVRAAGMHGTPRAAEWCVVRGCWEGVWGSGRAWHPACRPRSALTGDTHPSPPAPPSQGHAADTYSEFAEQNREALQQIPPPLVALNYYKSGDL